MVQKLKQAGIWGGSRAPYIALIALMLIFATSGSVAIDHEDGYQITAAILALMLAISIIWPDKYRFGMVTDLFLIMWFMLWGWNIYTDLYPNHAGLFAVFTYPTMAVFVAFSGPLRFRIKKHRYMHYKTPHYGENLSPHFPSAKKRQGG